jgi:hypothetical protein
MPVTRAWTLVKSAAIVPLEVIGLGESRIPLPGLSDMTVPPPPAPPVGWQPTVPSALIRFIASPDGHVPLIRFWKALSDVELTLNVPLLTDSPSPIAWLLSADADGVPGVMSEPGSELDLTCCPVIVRARMTALAGRTAAVCTDAEALRANGTTSSPTSDSPWLQWVATRISPFAPTHACSARGGESRPHTADTGSDHDQHRHARHQPPRAAESNPIAH